MRKNIQLVLLILLLPYFSYSQHKIYLGTEGAIGILFSKYDDPGNTIKTIHPDNSYFGLTIGRVINNRFSLESGILLNAYNYGYAIKYRGYAFGAIGTDFISAQIPFRLRHQLNLHAGKIFLSSTAGFHLCMNTDYPYGVTGGNAVWGENDSIIAMDSTFYKSKIFPLVELGAGVDFKVFKNAYFSVFVKYYMGLINIETIKIQYRKNLETPVLANGYSRGSCLNYGIAFRYPISDLWQSKK